MVDKTAMKQFIDMLNAGVSVEEIAHDVADTLNAANEEYQKAHLMTVFEDDLAHLTDEFNIAMEKYSKLCGAKISSNENFTVEELKGILNAKILNATTTKVEKQPSQKELTAKAQKIIDEMLPTEEEKEDFAAYLDFISQLFG